MSKYLPICILALTLLSRLSTASEAAWGTVAHSPVRDQGEAGICWSYSTTGLIEAEALKRGVRVTLSPEYLAFYKIYNDLNRELPVLEVMSLSTGAERLAAKAMIKTILHPQTGIYHLSEALSEIENLGVVPEQVFAHKFSFGLTGHQLVRVHPDLDEQLEDFVENKLLNPSQVLFYEDNNQAFFEDFSKVYGAQPPGPNDPFVYDGKTYTAKTFLSEYLGFVPGDYQEFRVNLINHAQAMETIVSALRAGVSVPLDFPTYEDIHIASQSGVFDPANCWFGFCHNHEGGHSVLVVGAELESEGGDEGTLLVKNSWGNQGFNDEGGTSGSLGFYKIKIGYLKQSELLFGWSFVVPASFIEK